MQSPGLINDLFDVHGDRHALGDAAGQRAGLSSFHDPCRLVQPKVNLRKNDGDALFGDCAVHAVLPLRETVALHRPGQSSRTGVILWLLSGHLDHEILAQPPKGPK